MSSYTIDQATFKEMIQTLEASFYEIAILCLLWGGSQCSYDMTLRRLTEFRPSHRPRMLRYLFTLVWD